MKGTVKFFNQVKEFGFIKPDDNSRDIYVNKKDIVSGVLNEGDKVEYEIGEGEQGKKAINVKKIS
jgi:CspA family cold shock protein